MNMPGAIVFIGAINRG